MAAARRIPGAPAAEQSVPPDTVQHSTVESVPSLAPSMAAAQPVFPDEILEEIFVRLDAAADLARASAACSSFLSIVSARRFRSLHPPPVLGMLSSIGYDPADRSVTIDRGLLLLFGQPEVGACNVPQLELFLGRRRCYAHGCFFWVLGSERKLLMLDTQGMKFSTIDLPPKNVASRDDAIVEAGEGRLGLLTLGHSTIDLSCKIICRNNGVSTEGWQHYKTIPLPKEDSNGFNYHWSIMDAEGRYVSLMAMLFQVSRLEFFVLDLKTMLLERLCVPNRAIVAARFYASFPPPFAPPSL
ncbi:unnamed protein product [Urochloa decumbens]|uniref:F-box domain-containing protein n=1 Tax=Urochloa decumbens TaxID=240449 RepID=A0ABC9GEC3_9POAL